MIRRFLFSLLLALLFPVLASAQSIIIYSADDTSPLDLAFIQEGVLVTNLNYANEKGIIARYTGVDLGEAPQKILCRATFQGGGAIALISSAGGDFSLAGIQRASIHAVFTSNGYHFGFYEGGVLIDVLAGEYTLDTTGNTEYTFGYTIVRNTITLQLPNGKTVKKVDDPRVSALNGPIVIFEHYLSPEDVTAEARPAITYVYAKGKSLPALEDTFQRRNGLPIQSPTGHAYVSFRNN